MTSINESNLKARMDIEKNEAYHKGYSDGYDVGHERANREARKGMRTLRTMQYLIALILGMAIAIVAEDIKQACAAEAQTSVEVVVTAEVACNPMNCPEPGTEEPLQVESAQEDSTLWSRMVKWWQALF